MARGGSEVYLFPWHTVDVRRIEFQKTASDGSTGGHRTSIQSFVVCDGSDRDDDGAPRDGRGKDGFLCAAWSCVVGEAFAFCIDTGICAGIIQERMVTECKWDTESRGKGLVEGRESRGCAINFE